MICWCIFIVTLALSNQGILATTTTTSTTTSSTTPTTSTSTTTYPATTPTGQLTIAIEPSTWINYEVESTVTFTLDPPCPKASIFRAEGHLRVCAVGPACPFTISHDAIQYADDGSWIRTTQAVKLPTGHYFAQCPPPRLRIYQTSGTTGNVPNVAIGVNPFVLKLLVLQGAFLNNSYHLTRTPGSHDDEPGQFTYTDTIPLTWPTFKVQFGVGKGRNPIVAPASAGNLLSTNSNFTFQVPHFDFPGGIFSFTKKNILPISVSGVSPPGNWYSYTFRKDDLAAAGLCYVDGRAQAHLKGAERADTVNFSFNVSYPATVGTILVTRSSQMQSCSCVFTCKTVKCPSGDLTISRSEWAFFDNSSSSTYMIRYINGNVEGSPSQYRLSPQECQEKFLSSKRNAKTYNVRCRVYGDSNYNRPIADRTESLYQLLRPCNREEFECTHILQCIPGAKRCNGRKDCQDGSDENNCVVGNCHFGDFHCAGMCVPSFKICDGHTDCSDGDEANCTEPGTPCVVGYFKCGNGKCTRGRYVCDNDNDCGDRSDEIRCGSAFGDCAVGEFICPNGRCVSRGLMCNGNDDCGDGGDEANCGTYYSPTCGSDYWQCANGGCIISHDLCDGSNDCGDLSDEAVCGGRTVVPTDVPVDGLSTVCQPGQFTCGNGRCTARSNLCDGDNDCGDSSDESTATCRVCPNERFHCRNNRCINPAFICDGDNDCRDSSDELPSICEQCLLADPPMWKCRLTAKCLHISRVCDGRANCGAGDTSDESDEACRTAQEYRAKKALCGPGTVKCTSTETCVPISDLCNGVVDCCPVPTVSSRPIPLYSANLQYPLTVNATHVGDCEKTDEIGCSRSENCRERNGGCVDKCVPIFKPAEISVCGGTTWPTESAYCACASGYYRPLASLTSCLDVNECKSPFSHNCSHTCTNTIGSYQCSCKSGFQAAQAFGGQNISTLCRLPKSHTPQIVFGFADTLRVFTPNKTADVVVQAKSFGHAFRAADVDIRDGTIIFAESGDGVLHRTMVPVNGKKFGILPLDATFSYKEIVDMAVDFIGDNLYVADVDLEMRSRIVVSRVNGLYQKQLIHVGVPITSIAVNPFRGVVYYATYSPPASASQTDGASVVPSIVMMSMNGSIESSVEIYKSTRLASIRTISVDYLGDGRIYYCVGSQIVLANSDGSENKTFQAGLFAPSQRAFDVFGDFLYGFFTTFSFLSAASSQQLFEADKFSRRLVTNLTQRMTKTSIVRVYHPQKAGLQSLWPTPCRNLNCSHLCLLNMEGSASCACPDGDDQENCTSAVHDAPDHPANCPSTCQGTCVKAADRQSFECICNHFFFGPFCNETLMPNITLNPQNVAVDSSTGDSSSLSSTRTALIVVASFLGIIVIGIVGLVLFYWYRRKNVGLANFRMQQLTESHENVNEL